MKNVKMFDSVQDKRNAVLCVFFSLCGICGIVFSLKIGTDAGNFQNNFANNILYFMLVYLLYKMWNELIKNFEWRSFIISSICGVLFSSLLILGNQLDYLGGVNWTVSTVGKVILLTMAICPIVYKIFRICDKYQIEKTQIVLKRKYWLISFGSIFLIWMLTYLALFPGVYGYDAPNQIIQGLGKIPYSTYQPIVHSWMLGVCVELGYKFTGSYEIGLGIYSFLQLTFMTYVATQVCMYILKKTKNYFWWIGSLTVFCLFPLHSVFAVSSTKDIIFTGIFTLLFIKVLEMTECSDEFWSSPKKIGIYSLLLFTLCWFRNNGLHIVICMLLMAVILLRKQWKKIILFTLIPLVGFTLIQNSLIKFDVVDVGPTLREMMSVPCQQLARVYTYNNEDLSSSERETLFEYIPEEALSLYSQLPMISDSAKGSLNTEKIENNMGEFFSFYLKMGVKNPKSYIEAFMLNTLGTWYPNKLYPDERMFHPYIETKMINAKAYWEKYIQMERMSVFPHYEHLLVGFFEHAFWKNIPIVSSAFILGTYTWIVVLCTFYVILRRNYKALVPLSLLYGVIITMLLGPVSLIRYGYPLIFTAPIVISVIFRKRYE